MVRDVLSWHIDGIILYDDDTSILTLERQIVVISGVRRILYWRIQQLGESTRC